MNPKFRSFIATAAMAFVVSTAQADVVLYDHTFDGSNTSIDLVAPDTANTDLVYATDHGITDANWVITGNNTPTALQDGSINTKSMAQLDFIPEQGFIYTLTVTATVDASGWLGAGFLDSTAGNLMYNSGIAWVLKRNGGSSNTAQFNANGGTGNVGSTSSTSDTATVRIVLDTTDGPGLWDVDYYSEGSTTPFASVDNIGLGAERNINKIGYSSEASTNSIQSLTLTVASNSVPPIGETISLYAIGAERYVVVNLNRNIALIADAGSPIGFYANFVVEEAANGHVALRALANNNYVLAAESENCNAIGTSADNPYCQFYWEETATELQLKSAGVGRYLGLDKADVVKCKSNSPTKGWKWLRPTDIVKLDFQFAPLDDRYPSDDTIFAGARVTDEEFNLPADSANVDCTDAFQAAIDKVAEAGGGNVFIPEGVYRVDGPLVLHGGVFLEGRWVAPYEGLDEQNRPYSAKLGSLIKVGMADINAENVIEANKGGLSNLTFWDATQDPVAGISERPWIIKCSNINRITMLNAYKGLHVAIGSNADVKNVYGSAYHTGVKVRYNAALARYRNFHFSPDFLEWSGLVTGSESEKEAYLEAHAAAVYATGSAIESERLGMSGSVKGHHKGFTWFKEFTTKAINGDFWSQQIVGCYIGVSYEAGSNFSVNNSTISNCEIAIQSHVTGKLTLKNAAILNSGTLDVEALGGRFDVYLSQDSYINENLVSLAGGIISGDIVPVEEEEEEISDDDLVAAPENLPQPVKLDVFDVSDPQFAGGAVGNGLNDDTAAVHAAVTAANINGGGVVFFPTGDFRITQNLPPLEYGVELRGSTPARVQIRKQGTGSTLRVDIPDVAENEEDEPAFITLGDYCGVRGMGFFYPNQTGGGETGAFLKYPFTIRGNGESNYVVMCSAINPYRYVNFNGDNNLLAYGYPAAIREVVFANGTKNGYYTDNMCKPSAAWPKKTDFPCPEDDDGVYKYNIAREGMTLFHLKDSDNYKNGTGSYAHAGALGLLVENSGGNFGRCSLEAYGAGYAFVSGDKTFQIDNKISLEKRALPDEWGSNFAVKLFPEFKGKVIATEGPKGTFDDVIIVEGGTLHYIAEKFRHSGGSFMPRGIRVGPNGSLVIEDTRLDGLYGIENEGSMKFINCNFKDGMQYPYGQTFQADNTIGGTYLSAALGQLGYRDFGLTLDQTDTYQEQVPYRGGAMKQEYQTLTTNKQFNFTVDYPEAMNHGGKIKVEAEGWFPQNVNSVQFWYYSSTGWKKAGGVVISEGGQGEIKLTLGKDTAFGQQTPEDAHLPDLRLLVTGTVSPRLKGVRIYTGNHGAIAPASPTGLLASTDSGTVRLDWDDHPDSSVTYNVYRRYASSGAFGQPIATGLTTSAYIDNVYVADRNGCYVVTAVGTNGLESAISYEACAEFTLLYEHTFNGSPVTLNGTSIDITTAGSHGIGTVWTADSDALMDGSFDSNSVASLSFTPEHGHVYALNVEGTYSGSGWIGIGFATANNTKPLSNNGSGLIWGLTRPGAAADQVAHFKASGGINNVAVAQDDSNPSAIAIILDTSEGTGLWDVEWFINGVSFHRIDDIDPSFETNINAIKLQSGFGANTFDWLEFWVD